MKVLLLFGLIRKEGINKPLNAVWIRTCLTYNLPPMTTF